MVLIKTWIKILIVFSKRIYRLVIDFILIFFFGMINLLRYKKLYDDNILFISAAEKNYFSQLRSLIETFQDNSKCKLIIYDIGLEKNQVEILKKEYKDIEIRTFDFKKYPEFVSQYFDGKLGNYAWKPIIVNEILEEFKSKVVWLDAGNLINSKIIFLKITLTALGLVVPVSSNRIIDWTHSKTIDLIGLNKKFLKSNNYASGLIGFDYNLSIAKQISAKWSEFSQIQECISPIGSSRDNHRQDQAVLTLLLYKYLFKSKFKKFFYPQTNFIYGVLFHRRKIYNF